MRAYRAPPQHSQTESAVTRRMLINAENPGEVRIAVLDGGLLAGYQIEVAEGALQRGNIFRGVIANVQPALNAAFIDFGAEKHRSMPAMR